MTNTNGTAFDATSMVQRLTDGRHAVSVDERKLDDWIADGGECVALLTADGTRFPDFLDVAVVLPELARRVWRWPWSTLLWLHAGAYVTRLSSMTDWNDYVANVAHALGQPTTRTPWVDIPGRTVGASPGCHELSINLWGR
ncbi:hydrogenase [Paraburkholderia youngii]|uniref:hydrogenase n=1 Tax=Paraburkholderia youngii TaxID=2782701 RepID=UPI003D1F87A3